MIDEETPEKNRDHDRDPKRSRFRGELIDKVAIRTGQREIISLEEFPNDNNITQVF